MKKLTIVSFNFSSCLKVVAHSSQMIYTRMIGDKEGDDAEAEGGVVVSRNNIHLMATSGTLHENYPKVDQSIILS